MYRFGLSLARIGAVWRCSQIMNPRFSPGSPRRIVARHCPASFCIFLMQTCRCSTHLGASQDSRAGRPAEN
ncbi:hypothetical protein [Klebsiella indica]|uniref:hypothetical protein n=1 Tax=Klebsiella indica TaxID=2582917 RepID=UPI003BAB41C5